MARRVLVFVLLPFAAGLSLGLATAAFLTGRPLSRGRLEAAPVPADSLGSDLIPLPDHEYGGSSRGQPSPAAAEAWQPRVVRTESRTTPPLDGTRNYLLVGLDRRTGGRSGRADTIVVAVFDRGSDHVGLVSIPRDLYVEFPGHGPARINAAFGIARKAGTDGVDLLRRVVEDTLAIPIDHFVAVDLDIFERAVDALGGVSVDVPCPIEDNFVDPRQPTGRRPLVVPAGRVTMDGATAAMYVRSRHGRSDWDRARRQQAVLQAMRDRLLTAGGLARVPTLLDELGANVETDMTGLDLLRLSERALRARPEHVHGLVIGHEQTEHWTTAEGRWVLLPRYDEIDRALASLFSAPGPGARPAGALCPSADVALTREGLGRARRAAASEAAMEEGYSEDPDVDSNSSHSPRRSP